MDSLCSVPGNCGYDEWSEWGLCTMPLNGIRKRFRYIFFPTYRLKPQVTKNIKEQKYLKRACFNTEHCSVNIRGTNSIQQHHAMKL